jgi:Methyltransferase domain
MNCYDAAPEFIDEDNRRFRGHNPISKEQMAAKHSVLLPESLIKGKTILDLGCCMGATGHWALSHGAAHYTGIELQTEYAEGARRLFDKYHPDKFVIYQTPIEKWLSEPHAEQYDIVCILGVIYAFIDYFSILKYSTALARSTYIVEGLHLGITKDYPNFCGVGFIDEQPINLSNENSAMVGRGTRVSPKGMEWIMKEFGFDCPEGMLYPPPVYDVPDIYNRPLSELSKKQAVRYLMRFERTSDGKSKSISDELQSGTGKRQPWEIWKS